MHRRLCCFFSMVFSKSLSLVLFFFGMWTSSNTLAVTIVVDSTSGGTGGPSCTLADAIIAANTASPSGGCTAGSVGQDQILFDSIVYGNVITLTADLPTVIDDLLVTSPLGSNQITINGDSLFAIFTIDSAAVELVGLKFIQAVRNGSSFLAGSGSAVRATNQATVSIIRSRFSDNVSPGAIQAGGAVFSQDSQLRVSGSVFSENQAHWGGALGAFGGELYVENSRFIDNVTFTSQQVGSVGAGGAVAVFGAMSSLKIIDSEFQGNQSQYGGAFFINSDVNASIEGTRFIANVGPWGGAIRGQSFGLTLTVKDSHMAHNIATVYGGAIYTELGRLNVLDSLIESNQGGLWGGAVFAYATDVALQRVTTLANSAQLGGAVYIHTNPNNSNIPAGTLQVHNSTLSENFASQRGGAVALDEGSSAYITNSTLARNQAEIRGGALYAEGGIAEVGNSTFSQNTANGEGGVIYLENASVLKLSNSTMAENNGGSLFTFQSSQSILQNTVIAGGNCDQDAGSQVILVSGVHIDDGTCGATLSGPSLLSGLGSHGGPTETHIPTPGSPLIDQGVAGGGSPPTDQRGLPRISGADLDIGSVEVQQ